MDTFQAGDIVKLGPSFVGIIEAVFTSKETDIVIYTIRWVKNVWQFSATEQAQHSSHLELATVQDLLDNLEYMRKKFSDNEQALLDRLQEVTNDS